MEVQQKVEGNLSAALKYFFDESIGKIFFTAEEWAYFEKEIDKQINSNCICVDFEKALEGVINSRKVCT